MKTIVSLSLSNLCYRYQTFVILIKPDLSLTNRNIEALLLIERWRLIQSGVDHDRRHIKTHGSNMALTRGCVSQRIYKAL